MLKVIRVFVIVAGFFFVSFFSNVHADKRKIDVKGKLDRESEWRTTDKFARKALGDREWPLVRELYQNALKLNLTDEQKARAYSYIGATYFNEEQYHLALENLDQAIYVLEKQIAVSRPQLMNIIKFAMKVAHAANDRAGNVRYMKKLWGYYSTNPKFWQIEPTKDIYRHKFTGINFSEKLGEFDRKVVVAFKDTGLDVGVNYYAGLNDGQQLTISVYLTYFENQSLDKIFSSYDMDIKKHMDWVELRDNGTFKIPGSKSEGRYVLYATNYGKGEVQSGMWLIKFDDWYIKIRATFDDNQGKTSRKKIFQFIKNFPWPVQGIKMAKGA